MLWGGAAAGAERLGEKRDSFVNPSLLISPIYGAQ